MAKGWEFFWEGRRYCVGAPDAPTARKYLREGYLHVAQRARVPKVLAQVVVLGLQLHDGTVRIMSAPKVKD
jgi:hypothetical protein